jgi:hypothetical protein
VTLPNGADGLGPNIALAFPLTVDSTDPNQSLANRDGFDQPTVESMLKEDIKASQGWNGASNAMFAGLPSGVPYTLGILAKVAEQVTGIPVSNWVDMWTSNPVVGSLEGYIQNALGSIFTVQANLQSLFSNLDFTSPDFDPSAALQSWINLGLLPTGLFTGVDWNDLYEAITGQSGSGLPDLANLLSGGLFGPILGNQLTALPFTHFGGTAENLLGSFDDPASIVQGGGWSHDPAVGRTTPGSLQVTANGSERSFKSEVINVKEDQEFQASIYATWAGLTFSGSDPFQLRVLKYLNGTAVGTPVVLAAPTSPGANQPAWTLLDTPAGMSGFFAVPAGINQLVVELFVPSTTSAGDIHFDDPNGVMSGGMSMDWIPGLPDSLDDIFGQLSNTWDALYQSFSFLGGNGIPLANMATEAQNIAYQAVDALTLGAFHNSVLNFRKNRPGNDGLESTIVGSHSLDAMGTGATPTNFGVTQASSAMVFQRMPVWQKLGLIQWRSSGNTNITEHRINVYKMDSTGNLNHVYTSPNLAGQLTSAWQWQVHAIPDADQIDVEMGDVIAVEHQVIGTGTLTVMGTPTSWMTDNHPTSRMKRRGARRNTGTTTVGTGQIAAASVGWDSAYPYFGVGVNNLPANYIAPDRQIFTTPTWSYAIPDRFQVAGAQFDCVVLGGGGGGQASGAIFNIGASGAPGQWNSATLIYGTDIPLGTTTITGTVGAAGGGGPGPSVVPGGGGGDSTITISGWGTLTGAGGGGGIGWSSAPSSYGDAPSPQNLDFAGTTFNGGGGTGTYKAGNAPGGSGSGSSGFSSGYDGARGQCWVYASVPA